LSELLNIPNPRIIAWSAQKTNPVGAEYIMEEKAPGQSLRTLWKDRSKLPISARFGIIRQIVQIERKLTDTKLKHHGCLYFKDDFPQGKPLGITNTIPSAAVERFRMGPSVDTNYWEEARANMDLDRGPCKPISPTQISPSDCGQSKTLSILLEAKQLVKDST
jgi:hypothetical protein